MKTDCESMKAQKQAELDASCSLETSTSSWAEETPTATIIHFRCEGSWSCESITSSFITSSFDLGKFKEELESNAKKKLSDEKQLADIELSKQLEEKGNKIQSKFNVEEDSITSRFAEKIALELEVFTTHS